MRRVMRSRGRGRRPRNEVNDPARSSGQGLDEAGVRQLIDQVLRERQEGSAPASVTRGAADTPVELPVPRQQGPGGGSGIPLVPMSQRRIEPIHGLVSQYQPPEF